MSRITSVDLILEYKKSNGIILDESSRFDNSHYCQFIEYLLLNKLNEEREVEELFNNTAVI